MHGFAVINAGKCGLRRDFKKCQLKLQALLVSSLFFYLLIFVFISSFIPGCKVMFINKVFSNHYCQFSFSLCYSTFPLKSKMTGMFALDISFTLGKSVVVV